MPEVDEPAPTFEAGSRSIASSSSSISPLIWSPRSRNRSATVSSEVIERSSRRRRVFPAHASSTRAASNGSSPGGVLRIVRTRRSVGDEPDLLVEESILVRDGDRDEEHGREPAVAALHPRPRVLVRRGGELLDHERRQLGRERPDCLIVRIEQVSSTRAIAAERTERVGYVRAVSASGRGAVSAVAR